MTHKLILAGQTRPDATPPANSPADLLLETGTPDDNRRELAADHPRYGLFFAAWHSQDGWSLDTHAAFWRSTLDLWPRLPGNPARRVELAYAWKAALRRGLQPEQAAAALGYKPDSLRRMEIPELADELKDDAVTDYVLPRVYTHDEPEPPDPNAYPNVIVAGGDERTREIQRRLDLAGC